jgi:hypothetical protein
MSHRHASVQGHSVPHSRPRSKPDTARHPEEAQEVNDHEESSDGDNETEDMEEDDPIASIKGGSEAAQKIIFALQVSPDDPETREMAKLYIRKMYIDNGGLPFNPRDPIPHDLNTLSSEQLGYVIENMVIHTARTKQAEVISHATNTFSNLSYLFTGDERLVAQINTDSSLRQALLDTFLGVRINPVLSLIISASSHITNLIRSYTENGKRTSTTASQSPNQPKPPETIQPSSSATPYQSGFTPPESRGTNKN